jgi:hypothetical protein
MPFRQLRLAWGDPPIVLDDAGFSTRLTTDKSESKLRLLGLELEEAGLEKKFPTNRVVDSPQSKSIVII